MAIVIAKKKDTDVATEIYKNKSTVGGKSIVATQKMGSTE